MTRPNTPQEETDPSLIIHTTNVQTAEDLKMYYRQRLGSDFNRLPALLIDREAYVDLIQGDNAIFAEMIEKDKEAANEMFITYAGNEQNSILLCFHIETPDVGNRVCEFVKNHLRTKEHEDLHVELQRLALMSQKLHFKWKQAPFEYYKIDPNQPDE
jgi:hypothetical protein